MTELGFVERPVLDWLSGRRDRPDDHGLGWTYRDEEQMEKFGRRLDDPIVEPLLINALKFINHHRGLKTDEQALRAVEVLRATMDNPDLLAANRNTLDLLRDGVPLVLEREQPPVTVQFIEFDPAKEELNDFTVTNQYKVKGVAGVPCGHGPIGERHSSSRRRVQEFRNQRRLDRRSQAATPLPTVCTPISCSECFQRCCG